jgi:hypothetical protein
MRTLSIIMVNKANPVIKQHSDYLKQISYCFKIHANINGATIVASDSTINFGV